MPWMTDLFYNPAIGFGPRGPFQDRRLSQITLPGTHDSGCYRNQRYSNVYSVTQTQDIFQQLAGGIRYFDLRPAADGNEFWTYHGLLYWGGQLTGAGGILLQIQNYLDNLAPTDRELVILNISHFYRFTDLDHGNLVAALLGALQPHLVRYNQNQINIFECPYWKLLSEPAAGGEPPDLMDPKTLRSRVLILYDGALDTAVEPYVDQLPFTRQPPGQQIPGFFLLAPKYAFPEPVNEIRLFDQYANLGRVDDNYPLSGIRTDQLNKLRQRQNYEYTTLVYRPQPPGPRNWAANAAGGVAGTLHLLSWTVTPQLSITLSGTWEPLVAAQQMSNPLLLDLFCGPNRGWAGIAYDPAVDPQINIIYVDDYGSEQHHNAHSPWFGMAMPVAIAARMNVGPVGPGLTW